MSLYIPEIRCQIPERRSGHVCLCFEDKVIVWGGYNDNVVEETNEYIVGNFFWVYNISTCLWRHVECDGDVPVGRSGACAAILGQTMYLFGGHCDLNGHCNELYSLNLVTFRWRNLTEMVKGKRPLPRDKFGCCMFKNRIIYFGGYGPSEPSSSTYVEHEDMKGWNAELVVLEINSNNDHLEWKYPNSMADAPQARAAHSMTAIGKIGYLFGGRHSGCRDNDVHSLDLEKYEWSGRLPVTGVEPCGRSWQIFVPCGTENILMHGGFDNNDHELDDAWLLQVHSLTWVQIEIFNKLSVPRSRLWHAACKTNNEGEVVIFGGCSSSFFTPPTEYSNDIMFFNSTPRRLQRLCEDVVVQNKMALYNSSRNMASLLPRAILRRLAARMHQLPARSIKVALD